MRPLPLQRTESDARPRLHRTPRVRPMYRVLPGIPLVVLSGLLHAGAPLPPAAQQEQAGVRCIAELERAILKAETPQTAVLKITLAAPPFPPGRDRPPVNLAIMLDRSASMAGEKMERARDAVLQTARQLQPSDRFSIVAYDHIAETIVANRSPDIAVIEAEVKRIEPRGHTNLFGALSKGAQELRKLADDPRYIHRLIIVSDGQANVGPNEPAELGRLGSAFLKEGISVSSIGIGGDYSEDLLIELSQRSDGNSYHVATGGELSDIFSAELGDVLSVVARSIDVSVTCAPGVRPLRLIGRDGRIDGNAVAIRLNHLYAGQEKYVLLEMEIPAREAGSVQQLAVAECTYEDAVDLVPRTVSAAASAHFSVLETEIADSVNYDVQSAVWFNNGSIAQDQAIQLLDEGNVDEAVNNLLRQSAELREVGKGLDNAALVLQADELVTNARSLAAEGLSNTTRKVMRAQSFQARNQMNTQQVFEPHQPSQQKPTINQAGAANAVPHGASGAEDDP